MRFFISYKRRVDRDNALAHFLYEGLKAGGHEVFIDTGIPVGADWAAEIERRIDWCDFLVLLLSAGSVESEMVQGEVRLAHNRRRPDGRPGILPIRVAFDGPLPYELSCYLARLQYLTWNREEDSHHILDNLKTASVTEEEADRLAAKAPMAAMAPAAPASDRPQPSTDLRCFLRLPGGAMRVADPFYIRRPQDAAIEEIATLTGETLVIKAPRQMGKSSLLCRYLDRCEAIGKRWGFVDFQCFTNADLANYLDFLKHLAEAMARSLELSDLEAPAFESQQSFSYFMEDELIRRVGGPLTLGFDEVERILGRPYQGDFFSLLRFWHNERSRPRSAWEEVDLALVISTEPYLLINDSNQSPFNVTPPVKLEPFTPADMGELNRRYGGPLNLMELQRLYELLGGHPYLSRLAFYRLTAGGGMAVQEILDRAAAEDGPFGEHLRRLRLLLQEQGGLATALRQAMVSGTMADRDQYHRLEGAGLIRRQNGRVVPANLLYGRYFGGRQ